MLNDERSGESDRVEPRRIRLSSALLWGAIGLLLILLIFEMTVNSIGHQDVLDAVSFAGTLVGIILAILAIIYSYLVTDSQKGDSNSLRAQIFRLGDTIGKANESSQDLASELGKLEEVRTSLQAISAVSNRMSETLTAMNSTATQTVAEKNRDEKPGDGVFKDALLNLVQRATTDQALNYFLSIELDPAGATGSALLEKYIRDLIPPGRDASMQGQFHELWATYFILFDLGLFRDDPALRDFKAALAPKLRNPKQDPGTRTYDWPKLQARLAEMAAILEEQ